MSGLLLTACLSIGTSGAAFSVVPDERDAEKAVRSVLASHEACAHVEVTGSRCRRLESRDPTTKACLVSTSIGEVFVVWDYLDQALLTWRRYD